MDWSTVVISLLLAGYIYLIYRRRERDHRARVALLRQGIAPSFERPRPNIWKVLSGGLVALLLIIMTGWFAYMASLAGKGFGAHARMGLFFGLIGVIVLAMFVDTLRRFMKKA